MGASGNGNDGTYLVSPPLGSRVRSSMIRTRRSELGRYFFIYPSSLNGPSTALRLVNSQVILWQQYR